MSRVRPRKSRIIEEEIESDDDDSEGGTTMKGSYLVSDIHCFKTLRLFGKNVKERIAGLHWE